MKLFPHNQKAYEAVMNHFSSGHNRAAVIQPTGTGKTYICGAVASHYNKVLVVAPNDYVLAQATSTTPHADTATYALLSVRDTMPTGYDMIWFDEIQRIGAPTWQGGAERLIAANPQAKILGSTATPDRALEQRNMADEFFDGDVVSCMTLTDAWVNHILRAPKYIIGVVSMGSTQADYKNKINASKRIDEAQKTRAITMLDNIVRDWSHSYGIPQILRKYIDKDVERMIVFAQTISKLDKVVSSIRPWFNQAGIKLANVYSVHSGLGNEAKKQMDAFENDTTEGIKVLVSVDMLNEGVHVDRVDAVMLLRSTISKNLYLQQIGRCFAVGQKHQPIILDMADNLTSACGYEGIYNAQSRFVENIYENSTERTPDEFIIIDTLKETREVIAQIDKTIAIFDERTYEEKLSDYVEFCEKNHRLPSHSHTHTVNMTDDERNEHVLANFALRNSDHPVIMEMRDKYKSVAHMDENEKVEALIDYMQTYKRIPRQLRRHMHNVSRERTYENKMSILLSKHKDEERVNELFLKYREMKDIPYDKKIAMCREFIDRNGRLPVRVKSSVSISELTDDERYERRLASYMTSHHKDRDVMELRKGYERFQETAIEEKRAAILNWCEEHGTYTKAISGDSQARRYTQWVASHPDDEIIPILREKYGYKPYGELIAEKRQAIIDFITANGRLPRKKVKARGINLDVSDEESMLADSLRQIVRNHSDDTEIIDLRDKYMTKRIDLEAFIEEVYTFCKENGHRPAHKNAQNEREAYLAKTLTSKYDAIKDDPRIKEVIMFPYRHRNCKHKPHTDIRAFRKKALVDFIREHGYWPRYGAKFGEEGTTASYWARFKETDAEVMELYRTTPQFPQANAMKTRQRLIDMLTTEYRKPNSNTERSLCDILSKNRNDADIKEAIAKYEAHEYTPKRLAKRASRFSSFNEFYKCDQDAYHASKRIGCFEQITKHFTH